MSRWTSKKKAAPSWDALAQPSVERLSSGPLSYHPPSAGPQTASGGMAAGQPTSATPYQQAGAPSAAAPASLHGHGGGAHGHSHGRAGANPHGHSHGGGACHGHGGAPDLFLACGAGDMASVRRLVNEGADVRAYDDKGATALHWACLNNQDEICSYLLDSGADADAHNAVSGHTPAQWAAIHGYIAPIRTLVAGGADLTVKDNQGFSVLHHAAQYGQLLTLHYVLEQGVLPVDDVDDQGHTPLHWSAYRGHPETAQYLLTKGADITRADNTGCTALHWAALKNQIEVARVLVDASASLTAVDDTGSTPEACAVEKGHTTLAEYLRMVARNGRGVAPVAAAAEKNVGGKRLLMLAGLLLPLLLWLVSTYSALVAFSAWACITGVVAYFLGKQWSLQTQDGGYIGVLWASVVSCVVVAWTEIAPAVRAGSFLTGFTVVLLLVAVYAYYRLATTDPGFTEVSADMDEMLELAARGEPTRQFCKTCRTRKPLRAQHCLICGRCTALYSHHCPWAGVCVGHTTRHYNLFLLMSLFVLQLMFLLYGHRTLLRLPHAPVWFSLLAFIGNSYTESPALTVLWLWVLSHVWWTGKLTWMHTQCALSGRTLHERITGKTYAGGALHSGAHPWDRGTMENLQRFLQRKQDEDWAHVFSLDGHSQSPADSQFRFV